MDNILKVEPKIEGDKIVNLDEIKSVLFHNSLTIHELCYRLHYLDEKERLWVMLLIMTQERNRLFNIELERSKFASPAPTIIKSS